MLDSVVESTPEELGSEWAGRSRYWLDAVEKHTPKRKRRERRADALILTGHGVSISVDKGTLIIADGNTHYPAERRTWRLFKGALENPPRIVLIDGGGNLTLEALDWLAEQSIPLLRLGWDGRLVSMIGADGYLFDRRKLAWQHETRSNEAKRVRFATPLIARKIEATLENLQHHLPPSKSREKAIETARRVRRDLRASPPSNVSQLLAVEGLVASGYFYAWRALVLKWKAETRHPIPDEWRLFFSRSALNTDKRVGNRRATHPINAMLNYAYGILEGHVRIGVFASGHDPAIGIMHDRISPDRHSFVFDLMEPLRPIVDRAVLKLVQEERFSGADFVLQADGVCRLNPELARRVTQSTEGQLFNFGLATS